LFVEVIQVSPPKSEVNKRGNAYQVLELAFKDQAGKVSGKKLLSFQNQDVFNTFTKAKQGDKFNVTSEKVGDFWNWTAVEPAGELSGGEGAGTSTPQTKPHAPVGSRVTGSRDFETASERAARQRSISRQAVLNTAVAFVSAIGDKKATQDDILRLAGNFEDWVNRTNEAKVAPSRVTIEEEIPN
jgi:hypothetical protein